MEGADLFGMPGGLPKGLIKVLDGLMACGEGRRNSLDAGGAGPVIVGNHWENLVMSRGGRISTDIMIMMMIHSSGEIHLVKLRTQLCNQTVP